MFPRPPLRAWLRYAIIALAIAGSVWIVGTATRFYIRDYYIFVPDYLRWMRSVSPVTAGTSTPTHIFLLFADHFEPAYDVAAVQRWTDRYREMALRHRDADNRPVQHTWFYPGEQDSPAILDRLAQMTADGFGEVELHFHHDHDTYDTLKPRLQEAIASFQQHGFLKTIDGRTEFAFVHGNSGLDDSAGAELCGVDEELRLLRELGCYGDFTFPSVYTTAQPPFVNSIYAAADDPSPRSYRDRRPLRDLANGRADLMIFEGPLIFAPSLSLRHLFLDLDDADIHATVPASPARADLWVNADVHVPGRPDWRFVKLFAHGASTPGDEEAVLGPAFEGMLTYLEHTYNDGRRYQLHYVTAREAYNLAMAATAGVTGRPEQYYDYVVKPYIADRSSLRTSSAGRPQTASSISLSSARTKR